MTRSCRPLFFVLFLLATSAHADIVGGDDVPAADPITRSTVGLFEPGPDGRSGGLCTASLIGKDVAVTAAHCVRPGGPKPVLIFGKDLHSPDAVKKAATAVRVNPNWATHAGRGMDEGDIALVKFPGGLPPGYEPATPVAPGTELRKGDKAVLAGYGINDAAEKSGAGVLRKTAVEVANPRAGKSEIIFDQSHGHGACHGDSGGPAFVRNGKRVALLGVTNRSYPANAPDDCAHQVVYTKVDAYKDWIAKSEKEMGAHPSSPELSAPARAPSRVSIHRHHGLSHVRRVARAQHAVHGHRGHGQPRPRLARSRPRVRHFRRVRAA